MCLSCLAGLTTEVPKLHSARRKATDSATKVPSWPTKAPSLPHQPIQAASLEPKLGRSLADEVIQREKAEAKAAALQRQLGHERESCQELERKLLEGSAVEGRLGDAPSLLRSRASELQAQLDDERSKKHLQARLLGSTDPALQTSTRGELSERIAKEREICNLQAQLAEVISERLDLQSRLELLHGRARGEHVPRWAFRPRAPSVLGSSTPGISPPCFRGLLVKEALFRSDVPPRCAGGLLVNEASFQSDVPSRCTGGLLVNEASFRGVLVKEASFRSDVSLPTPIAASTGARNGYGYPGPHPVVTLVPVGTSSCSTPNGALHPGKPPLACFDL